MQTTATRQCGAETAPPGNGDSRPSPQKTAATRVAEKKSFRRFCRSHNVQNGCHSSNDQRTWNRKYRRMRASIAGTVATRPQRRRPDNACSGNEPAAGVRPEDCQRDDRRLELPSSRARERLPHAHPFDRLDLIAIRSPFPTLTVLCEVEMEGPFQLGGQIVGGVHLEELRRLVARLLHQLASRTCLRRLPVPGGPAG